MEEARPQSLAIHPNETGKQNRVFNSSIITVFRLEDEGQRSSRESPIPAETGSVEDNPLEYLMAQLLPDESSAEI